MDAGGSGDSPDSLGSLGSQTTQLTRKIQGLLAAVRREPLAHGLDGRTNLRLHHELAPDTPGGAETLPKLPSLPSTLSSSPEPSTAPSPCTVVPDSCVPDSLSNSPGQSTSLAQDAISAHAGRSVVSLSSTTPKPHAAAAQPLFDCIPDSARPGCSTPAVRPLIGCSVPSSSSGLDKTTEHEQLNSQQSAPGCASDDTETASPSDDMWDAAEKELSLDEVEYARFLRAVRDWGVSTHAPAAATQRPVQLRLSIHTDFAACLEQQSVWVQLLVTENDGLMKYQAACCGPHSPQEEQSLAQHPLSLEWLRNVHIEKARQYLMDVAGTASKPCTCRGACMPGCMLVHRAGPASRRYSLSGESRTGAHSHPAMNCTTVV